MDTEMKNWLLEGDVSLQYMVHRDLLNTNQLTLNELQARISSEGYGKRFLDLQKANGHWGLGFYQTKWISSHYTLLDLKNLGVLPTEGIMRCLNLILEENRGAFDGGINPAREIKESDICINGMFLDYACYFGVDEEKLMPVVDFFISQQMPDGGYNCRKNRSGAKHSSLHSTISCLEGIRTYKQCGYTYSLDELLQQEKEAVEFILMHKLFKSDHTGQVINKGMTMLSYPSRWKYDILRAMDYFVSVHYPYDERMSAAIELIKSKQRKDGRWPVQARHAGKLHFEMEKTGRASRMNTFRVLRMLEEYPIH